MPNPFTYAPTYHRGFKVLRAQPVVLVQLVRRLIFQIGPSAVLNPTLTSARDNRSLAPKTIVAREGAAPPSNR